MWQTSKCFSSIAILLIMCIQGIQSYSSGAPTSTCLSMAPNDAQWAHGAPPQNDPNNPKNTVDQYVDYNSGFEGPAALELNFFDRSKNVTIYMKDVGDSFRGFMLQVRYDEERYDRNFKKGPIGFFTVPTDHPDIKCMDCQVGGKNKRDRGGCNSITHRNGASKKEITVTWTKPDGYKGEDLYLKYTIAAYKDTYWVGLEYPPRSPTSTPPPTPDQFTAFFQAD